MIIAKKGAQLPETSLFYGIKITMYWNEYNPPHFHVEYAEHKALVDIQQAMVFRDHCLPGN